MPWRKTCPIGSKVKHAPTSVGKGAISVATPGKGKGDGFPPPSKQTAS